MAETLLSLLLALSELRDAESLRFLWCAEQGWDSSCGLAAVSSLMDIYWGVPAQETELAAELLARRGEPGAASGGLGPEFAVSFADMIALLRSRSFVARAYRMDMDQLRAAMRYAPLIAHYDRPEGHFVLVLSVASSLVITADPAEGVVALSEKAFQSRWSGNVMLVVRAGSQVRSGRVAEASAPALGRCDLLEREAARSGGFAEGGLGW